MRVTGGAASLESFSRALERARVMAQAIGMDRFRGALARGLDETARLTVFACAAASARVAGMLSPWARRGLERLGEEFGLPPLEASGVLEGAVKAEELGLLGPVPARDDGAFLSAGLQARGWQAVTPLGGARLSYLNATQNWLVVEHQPDEGALHLYVVSQSSPGAKGMLIAAVYGNALEALVTALGGVQDLLQGSRSTPGLRRLATACLRLHVLEDGNWQPAVGSLAVAAG